MGKEMLDTLDLMESVYPKGGLNLLGLVKNDIIKLGMTFTTPKICMESVDRLTLNFNEVFLFPFFFLY
jgi:hypothetical protein